MFRWGAYAAHFSLARPTHQSDNGGPRILSSIRFRSDLFLRNSMIRGSLVQRCKASIVDRNTSKNKKYSQVRAYCAEPNISLFF